MDRIAVGIKVLLKIVRWLCDVLLIQDITGFEAESKKPDALFIHNSPLCD
jgi:hypothetical protein